MLNFSQESIVIILKWTRVNGVTYDVIVVPQVKKNFNGTAYVQLMLSYNQLYAISVEATHCGGIITSSMVELNYSKSSSSIISYALFCMHA